MSPAPTAQRFLAAPVPEREGGRPGSSAVLLEPDEARVRVPRRGPGAFAPVPLPSDELVQDPPDAPDPGVEGYVLFDAGGATYAVAVAEVREVMRAARLDQLPGAPAPAWGHRMVLVDARGRSIPAADLRAGAGDTGDVLLPVFRHQIGLVVDRVLAVLPREELVTEDDAIRTALPAYVTAVLRPPAGGPPVLHVQLPATGVDPPGTTSGRPA